MEIQKKKWTTPAVVVISSANDIMGGAFPGYHEGTILGSQHGSNGFNFTIPGSHGTHAYSRAHSKDQYLS